MSKELIIISDTEEPGAFDRTSGVAVITVPRDQVYRWSVLAERLKQDHPDFSELRLWGSYAEFYEDQLPDTFLDALATIPDVERDAPGGPRITAAEVEALRAQYAEHGYFVWPGDKVEFDLLGLCNMANLSYGDEQLEEEPETISVDIEEAVVEDVDFRFSAYQGDQITQTKPMYYNVVLGAIPA